ncbi:rhodopsin, GQ-coupled-like [Diadema antillarum]|uniref:rhodopsin, GQ-coupled-like n=1 Tax=Diadema antillarum TaxID=105358 RepID=UPI003A89465A
MTVREACFSMASYSPGIVVSPSAYTEELQVCSPVMDSIRTTLTIVIGVTANAGALVLLWFSRKQEHSVQSSYNIPNVLVLVLCATDLTWLLFGENMWLVSVLQRSWIGGRASYLYGSFVITTCLRFSGCVVILMGVERYLSLLKPFFYDNSVTLKRMFLIIFLLGIYSFAMSTFHLVGELTAKEEVCNTTVHVQCFNKSGTTSLVHWTSRVYLAYDYITVMESLVNITVLVFCNVFVTQCMRQMRQRIDMVCPRNRDEYMKQVDMIRGVSAEFSRLMFGITLVFFVTVIPYEVRVLCNHFGVWYSPIADYISSMLYVSTTTINPLLYGLFRRKYRRKIWRKLLKLLTTCQRENRVSPQEDVAGKDDQHREDPAVVGTSSES